MHDVIPTLILTIIGAQLIDMLARDTVGCKSFTLRRPYGIVLNSLITLSGFGAVLGMSGNAMLAAALMLALHLLLLLVSNAKIRVLGEPLLFSDLALIGAVFKHPQFYFSVLSHGQKILGLLALLLVLAGLFALIEPNAQMALTGAAVSAISLVVMVACMRLQGFRTLAAKPDISADVGKLGLLPTLVLYWIRWRQSKRQQSKTTDLGRPGPRPLSSYSSKLEGDEIIVIVQCESFADPDELFEKSDRTLPHLTEYREKALEFGNLLVSGFGAYTMRTEYGVIFGQDEETLGFRLYDPYLTALRDVELALPNRLGADQWNCTFVHPHDMRFYGRDRILPKAGFATFVGEDQFVQPNPENGRYVTDIDVAEKILQLADSADAPSLIYAVTMENHGPWAKDGHSDAQFLINNYVELVQAGDKMLGRLTSGLAALKRPATLVFFGDHRPSIPGAVEPGGDKHTPFLIVQFDRQGNTVHGDGNRLNRTPAELHHRILDLAG